MCSMFVYVYMYAWKNKYFFMYIYTCVSIWVCVYIRGRDSSVGIATRYGLNGPGIESGGGEIFRILQNRPWGPPSLLYNEYRVFPGVKAAAAWR